MFRAFFLTILAICFINNANSYSPLTWNPMYGFGKGSLGIDSHPMNTLSARSFLGSLLPWRQQSIQHPTINTIPSRPQRPLTLLDSDKPYSRQDLLSYVSSLAKGKKVKNFYNVNLTEVAL